MKIAYIDHSYHEKTKSTGFVPEILSRSHQVDCFWDHSWKTHRLDIELCERVAKGRYDVVVLFQVFWSPDKLLEFGFRDVVLIPMYDAVCPQPANWWAGYSFCKILNFSRTLHDRHLAMGLDSLYVKYFPAVPEILEVASNGLSGFFWQRTSDIGWPTIRTLIEGTEFEKFYLHWAPDPGHDRVGKPGKGELSRFNIQLSDWFETRAEYSATINRAQVYFAPRRVEGIGMGFLEALAMGKCVVAPDTPTHNEYIQHQENGILYDPHDPKPLDFSDWEIFGANAQQTCREGHRDWIDQQEELERFICREKELSDSDLDRQIRLLRSEIALLRSQSGNHSRQSIVGLVIRLARAVLRRTKNVTRRLLGA